ncbi:hypothetical protein A5739_24950 [Mycobacterium colombiense]|nr:hypothetical protein A5739_24950 [Mycobacterium colombiense]
MLQRMTTSAAGGNLIGIIDRYRDQEGISDAEVARRIGVSRQNLHTWRSRGVNAVPARETLQDIAQGVHTTYAEVLSAALADTGHVDEFGTDDAMTDGSDQPMPPQQLGDFATTLAGRGDRTTVSLCQPAVLYEAHATGSADLTRWRAYLHLTDADDPNVKVIGGFAEFTVVHTPADIDLPDAFAASPFSRLFMGGELSTEVEAALDADISPVFNVVAVENVYVDPELRGHRLGPWLVSDIASRMADSTNGLLALYPHVSDNVIPTLYDDPSELDDRSVSYWQEQLHIPDEHEGFLLAHTSYMALTDAHNELHGVDGEFIAVDAKRLHTRRLNQDPELWPLTNLLNAEPGPLAGSISPVDHALDAVGSESLDNLMYILDSVDEDDLTQVRVATLVSFTASPLADLPECDLFDRASLYLEEHPDLGVSDVRWRHSLHEDGTPAYTLDLEVAPLPSARFSPRRADAVALAEFPWVVWRVHLIDPDRTTESDVSLRTAMTAQNAAHVNGCVYEGCVDDDLPDGTKGYAWILAVPQLKHRHQINGTPTAVLELAAAVQSLIPPDEDEQRSWAVGIDMHATVLRNADDSDTPS